MLRACVARVEFVFASTKYYYNLSFCDRIATLSTTLDNDNVMQTFNQFIRPIDDLINVREQPLWWVYGIVTMRQSLVEQWPFA